MPPALLATLALVIPPGIPLVSDAQPAPPPVKPGTRLATTPGAIVTAVAPGAAVTVAGERVRVRRGVVRARWRRDGRWSVTARARQVILTARAAPPRVDVFPFAPSPANRAPTRRDALPASFRNGPCATGCRPRVDRRAWPVRPFDRPHPLRAGFNEYRTSGFHLGIDVQVPDGTPVYALTSGYAVVPQRDGDDERVAVGRLEYWHIDRRVSPGDRVVAFRTVLGLVKRGFGHLHVSERWRRGRYLEPLRPGGRVLEPYRDTERPVIGRPQFGARGRVTIEAFDPQSTVTETTYRTPVLAPAGLAWRIFDARGRRVGPLRWVLRGDWLDPDHLRVAYSPRADHPGFGCYRTRRVCVPRWRYVLAGGLAPRLRPASLRPGRYRLTVYAWDWAGNVTARDASFTARPRPPVVRRR